MSTDQINELIARRWSGRAFDPDREISEESILAMLEAARWAPSCFGDQPWRIIICNKKKNRSAWEKAFSCLSEGNQSWAKAAPLLILAFANSKMTSNGNPNRWGQYDTGAACMNLCLQATAMDLMVHQMGGFDVGKVRKLFSIDEQYMPMSIMSIGYQLPLEKISEKARKRELAVRNRRPLSENFFNGQWGNPVINDS